MPKKYMVSDGKLVLHLTPDDDGWYTVTAPLEPGLVTMAKTIPEAFEMAHDALKGLREARRDARARGTRSAVS
jgi:predicted RNase H-like HicB family nuclease